MLFRIKVQGFKLHLLVTSQRTKCWINHEWNSKKWAQPHHSRQIGKPTPFGAVGLFFLFFFLVMRSNFPFYNLKPVPQWICSMFFFFLRKDLFSVYWMKMHGVKKKELKYHQYMACTLKKEQINYEASCLYKTNLRLAILFFFRRIYYVSRTNNMK